MGLCLSQRRPGICFGRPCSLLYSWDILSFCSRECNDPLQQWTPRNSSPYESIDVTISRFSCVYISSHIRIWIAKTIQVPFVITNAFSLVPLRYLRIDLTAAQWFRPGWLIIILTIPTTYALSGRVDTIAYINDQQPEAYGIADMFFVSYLSLGQCTFESFTCGWRSFYQSSEIIPVPSQRTSLGTQIVTPFVCPVWFLSQECAQLFQDLSWKFQIWVWTLISCKVISCFLVMSISSLKHTKPK